MHKRYRCPSRKVYEEVKQGGYCVQHGGFHSNRRVTLCLTGTSKTNLMRPESVPTKKVLKEAKKEDNARVKVAAKATRKEAEAKHHAAVTQMATSNSSEVLTLRIPSRSPSHEPESLAIGCETEDDTGATSDADSAAPQDVPMMDSSIATSLVALTFCNMVCNSPISEDGLDESQQVPQDEFEGGGEEIEDSDAEDANDSKSDAAPIRYTARRKAERHGCNRTVPTTPSVRNCHCTRVVTAQPGRDPRNTQEYTQDDPQWEREVRGATAVLEDLLEKWKTEPHAQDHVRVGRAVGVIGHHMTPARDLPRMVRKSLDELVPRLRLECILGFRIRAELESSPL
ncbi:hypothetical protein EDB89DRAFT_1909778 [Lactarius sanguifluus]|nr:hypothetical protein EDB89DRAFT_1909778 [Lactarius sanguifluus]